MSSLWSLPWLKIQREIHLQANPSFWFHYAHESTVDAFILGPEIERADILAMPVGVGIVSSVSFAGRIW